MIFKIQNNIMPDKSEKKSRKAITLDSKIKVIELKGEGVSQAEIG
jgi:hypothetical protein